MKAKVLIATPNLGSIHPLLVMRFLTWATGGAKGVEEVSFFMPTNLIPHDSARNFCVMHFLKTDFTHLFFIDSDVIPPENALEELVSADKAVVSGLYHAMRPNAEGVLTPMWAVYVYGNDHKGDYGLMNISDGEGIAEIRRAGAGCLMIRREVLEAMRDKPETMPWFRFQYHEKGTMFYGEDIDFCRKAESLGYPIHAHFGVRCQHQKSVLI